MSRFHIFHPLCNTDRAGASFDNRYLQGAWLDDERGWDRFWNDWAVVVGNKLHTQNHWLDRIGGLQANTNVHFGAMREAARLKDYKHIYRHRDFVQFWEQKVKETKAAGGRITGYLGCPNLDVKLQQMIEDPNVTMDKVQRYLGDSLNSLQESGFDLGFDAITAGGTDQTDWAMVNRLAEDGKTKDIRIIVEARGGLAVPIDRENLYCYESENGYALFSNKNHKRRDPPASWQDPDETLLDSYRGYQVLLKQYTFSWQQSPQEMIDAIGPWYDYRTPGGTAFDLMIPSYFADKLGDVWPKDWK